VHYKQGIPRDQLFLFSNCLDEIIPEDNPVRVIDVYVENLDIAKLGFKIPQLKTGTPPYRPAVLLKIYIYGHFERIRSSRRLENECNRNQEMKWLTEGLAPDFKTIADFRKNNRQGINNIFKEFLLFCHSMDLISLETTAVDGSKMRAQNSQNNIYKRETIDKVREKIQKKIEEYLEELDINDEKEANDIKLDNNEVKEIVEKLKKLKKHKSKVGEIKKKFEGDKELQIYFATDKDSRFQSDNGKIRAGYNVQIAGDNKNKLLIANDVTNDGNDKNQLKPMVRKVENIKQELEIKNKTELGADAGYYSEKNIIENINDKSIEVTVPRPKDVKTKEKTGRSKKNKVPAPGYEIDDFVYDKERGVYICPRGKKLVKTHKNPSTEKSGRKVFEYHCSDCKNCKKRHLCTKNKKGRCIRVSVNKAKIDNYLKRMQTDEKKKIVSKRKEIIEHPFGTIKRSLGFTYFMQKGIEKVKSEFSFICFIYNLKRVLNIVPVKELMVVLNKG